MPAGRPSTYTPELADQILEQLGLGRFLKDICAEPGMPGLTTVWQWQRANPEFAAAYAQAREAQAEALMDEASEIVDDGRNDWMERLDKEGQPIGWQLNGEHVQRSKLRAEHRRWVASKLKPRVYGERQQVELSGRLDVRLVDMTDEDLLAEVAELVATGALALPKPTPEEEFGDLA